jgi:anti-anti-sigma factor
MYNSKIENNKLIFSFPPKINHDVISEFEDDLITQVRENKIQVIFDLENVTSIVSSFLGICNKVYNEIGSEKFSIINVSPPVYEIFNITRLDDLFNIRLQI